MGMLRDGKGGCKKGRNGERERERGKIKPEVR